MSKKEPTIREKIQMEQQSLAKQMTKKQVFEQKEKTSEVPKEPKLFRNQGVEPTTQEQSEAISLRNFFKTENAKIFNDPELVQLETQQLVQEALKSSMHSKKRKPQIELSKNTE